MNPEIFELEKFEASLAREAALFAGSSSRGASFKVPFERMVYRDAQATAGTGADLVGAQIPFIQQSLGPTSLVAKLPLLWLEGLRGDLVLPRVFVGVTGPTGLAGTEIAAIAPTDPVFGANTPASPSRLTAQTVFSKQLLTQAAGNVSLDTFLTRELMRALSFQLDFFTLTGSGAAGQPNGLLTLGSSLTANTRGGAATWPNVLAAQETMEAVYFDAEDLVWLIGPATVAKWRAAARGTGNTAFHVLENTKSGCRCQHGQHVCRPDRTDLPRNWQDLVLGFFGNGFDVTYDQFSKAKTGEIVITISVYYVVQPRRPQSFLISTDGGNL